MQGDQSPAAKRTYQIGKITLTLKVTAAENGGTYTLMEAVVPPGSGAGLHRHPTYDDVHFVLEGHYKCQLGEEILELGPGEMMFAPRGTPHSFKSVGPEIGRELIISSPGGIFEAFIAEVTESQVNTGGPNSGAAKDYRSIAAKYGIEHME